MRDPSTAPRQARLAQDDRLFQKGAAGGCALLIGLFAALLPYFFNHRFYFHNDEETYFYPYCLEIGQQLRHGHWPLLSLTTFCGGNYSIDWELALFNPISLLSYWLMAPAHNLEWVGLCFAVFYIPLLTLGTYALGRSFGLGHLASLVMTAVMATNNYLIFFYAGAWMNGLISWCWFIWAWAALQSYRSSGRTFHLAAFVLCAYLTITSGWPHTTIMLALLTGGYFIELLATETLRSRKIISLILGGLSLTLLVSPYLLPAFLSFGWTARNNSIFNHGFLTPTFGDLLNSSTLFHLPHMTMYNAPAPFTPLLYLAWFLFPLVPLLDWEKAKRALANHRALGFFGTITLLLLYGPEHLGPLRYPIRFLPGVDTALLLGFLLATADADSFVFSKWRATASLLVVMVGFYASLCGRPDMAPLHVLGVVLSLILLLIAHHLIRIKATRFLFLWLIVGVFFSYGTTHYFYRRNVELAGPNSNPAITTSVSSAGKTFDGYSYYVGPNPKAAWQNWPQEFFFAAEGIYQRIHTINGDTPLGHRAFSPRISDNNWSDVTRPEAVAYLFSTNAETGLRIIDLMRVNTLLLEKNSTALWTQPFLDDQWKKVGEGHYSVRLEKSNPDYRPTTLAWSSPGIQVQTTAPPSGESEHLTVNGNATGGSLVFARLWWPGYGANLNGQPLQVTPLDDLFVKVSLPANARGLLSLTFTPPGLHLGFCLGGLGLLLLGLTLWLNQRRDLFRQSLDSTSKRV